MQMLVVSVFFECLYDDIFLLFIVYWEDDYFVVVYDIKLDWVWVVDFVEGKYILMKEEFLVGWSEGDEEGVILVLELIFDFYDCDGEGVDCSCWNYVWFYFW